MQDPPCVGVKAGSGTLIAYGLRAARKRLGLAAAPRPSLGARTRLARLRRASGLGRPCAGRASSRLAHARHGRPRVKRFAASRRYALWTLRRATQSPCGLFRGMRPPSMPFGRMACLARAAQGMLCAQFGTAPAQLGAARRAVRAAVRKACQGLRAPARLQPGPPKLGSRPLNPRTQSRPSSRRTSQSAGRPSMPTCGRLQVVEVVLGLAFYAALRQPRASLLGPTALPQSPTTARHLLPALGCSPRSGERP